MRTPCENETRFFAAGDDLNGMSQGCFGLGEKFGGILAMRSACVPTARMYFGLTPANFSLKRASASKARCCA